MSKTVRLILPPALISLAMTLLRLFGELGHWSDRWFEPVTRGILPSMTGWVFGITWLAVPFGIYFALRLNRCNLGPRSITQAVAAGLIGLCILTLALYLVVPQLNVKFQIAQKSFLLYLVLIWSSMAIAVVPITWAWPALSKTLAAYGLASRIPVAVVMFFAMRGNWGTHYDYVDIPQFQAIPFWERFITTAFIPQLIFWVAFTVMIGGLAGSLAAAVVRGRAQAAPATSPL